MRDGERLGKPARLDRPKRLWHCHRYALVDCRQLCLGPATYDCHDPVSYPESRCAGTHRLDNPGQLEARDVNRPARWGWVVPRHLEKVGIVEPGGLDSDEQLAGARRWLGALFHHDRACLDYDGAHVQKRTRAAREAASVHQAVRAGRLHKRREGSVCP